MHNLEVRAARPGRRRALFGVLAVAIAVTLVTVPANAVLIGSFSADDGGNRDATVTFTDLGGGILEVVLTNVEANDLTVQGDLLQGVAFSLCDSDGNLVALSVTDGNLGAIATAVLHQPATDVMGHAIGDLGVGYEWGYTQGAAVAAATSGDQWIAGVGAGSLLGGADRWSTVHNLQGPAAPDGAQYGITSAGDDGSTGQPAMSGTNALVQNSITFRLSGLVADELYTVKNVEFQYGTSIDLTPGTLIPEPATLSLLGIGLVGFALRRRNLRA